MATVTDLIVTIGGKPVSDQSFGLRLFKDMAQPEEHYRLVTKHGRWVAYYCGRRISDTEEMRRGADNPGVLIDQIRRIRGVDTA